VNEPQSDLTNFKKSICGGMCQCMAASIIHWISPQITDTRVVSIEATCGSYAILV